MQYRGALYEYIFKNCQYLVSFDCLREDIFQIKYNLLRPTQN